MSTKTFTKPDSLRGVEGEFAELQLEANDGLD